MRKLIPLLLLAFSATARAQDYSSKPTIPPTIPSPCALGNNSGSIAVPTCQTLGTAVGNIPVFVNFNGSGHAGLYITDTSGPGFSIKRLTTGANDAVDFQVTRNANYSGGDGSTVNAAFGVTTTTTSGANNFEYVGVFTLNNNNTLADASQNVALVGKATQLSTGITFGGNFKCISNLSTAQGGCVGAEIDSYVNGADVSGTRLPLHIIYGPGSFGGIGHVLDGVRIEQQQGGNAVIDRDAIRVDGDYLNGLTFVGVSSAANSNLINDQRTGPNLVYGLNLGAPYASGFIFARDNKNLIWSTDQTSKTRYVSADSCLETNHSNTVLWKICDDGHVEASGQIQSTVTTGTAPFIVASTTNVPNLNASFLGGATFANPGAIGAGTPGTGAFTSITATTTVAATTTVSAGTKYVHGVTIICDVSTAAATSHTGDSTETNLANCTIPAGRMSAQAQLRITALWLRTATTTNTVAYSIRFSTTQADASGGALVLNNTNATSGVLSFMSLNYLRNTATNAQLFSAASLINPYATNTAAMQTSALDTAASATYVNFNCKDTTSTSDTCGIYSYLVELIEP